jgi:hypothetical protein
MEDLVVAKIKKNDSTEIWLKVSKRHVPTTPRSCEAATR